MLKFFKADYYKFRLFVKELHPTNYTMVKRKLNQSKTEVAEYMQEGNVHNFADSEIKTFRTKLVEWYTKNKRDLPWRKQLENTDINQRAYAVWVSEIMLQQTQVSTVISYYNKWMEKWPTVEDLSKATLEEVNEMWSGLGYYSRGRRLHEGAIKVMKELQGEMPRSAESLLKELPGVGRYTAGAVASIAYNEPTGLVDGNVIRVLGRMRIIGADSTSTIVQDKMWSDANNLVDPASPRDFNQGLMELGATVCTPKTPECSKCPVNNICKAYLQVVSQKKKSVKTFTQTEDHALIDIECAAGDCKLCIASPEMYDNSLGVLNYPRKGKKKAAREETTDVCIVCQKCSEGDKYLMVQRPDTGLLAGLWEFPSLLRDATVSDVISTEVILDKACNGKMKSLPNSKDIGEVVHIFSHIHQTYSIRAITVAEGEIDIPSDNRTSTKWITKEDLTSVATSTAMKKVFKFFINGKSKQVSKQKEDRFQPSISSFFSKKS